MKLGWLLFQYAPPDLKLSRAQRRLARMLTWKAYRATPAAFAINFSVALVLGLLWGGLPVWIMMLDPILQTNTRRSTFFALCALLAILSWTAIAYAASRLYARAHRLALRDMGYDICIPCGYWLRGLPPEARQCPECGATRPPHDRLNPLTPDPSSLP